MKVLNKSTLNIRSLQMRNLNGETSILTLEGKFVAYNMANPFEDSNLPPSLIHSLAKIASGIDKDYGINQILMQGIKNRIEIKP